MARGRKSVRKKTLIIAPTICKGMVRTNSPALKTRANTLKNARKQTNKKRSPIISITRPPTKLACMN
jgi:hypothetical protein